jgi:predicted metal-dependent HD superfamily phosphohydrolase
MATKGHAISEDADTNYFTDADLAILGSNNDEYLQYVKSIRKEYKFYPDFVYNPGRKKVLEHFIQMPRIYKTDYFYNKYEEPARKNIIDEIRQMIS